MKKFVIIFASFVFITSIHAQLSFGVKAGPNIAGIGMENEAFKEIFNPGLLTSYHFGAFLNYKFGKFISIQPEVQLSQKGFTEQNLLSPDKAENRFTAIAIPLMLGFHLKDFKIEAGAELDHRLKSTYKVGGETFDNGFFPVGITGISLNFGLAYQWNRWIIGGRYQHGLTAIHDKDVQFTDINGEPIDNEIWQRVGQFYIGYLIVDKEN